ncbi:TNF receptor-associated factor 2 isoform X4 [Suricata suricatta]|uniref:TNF receptor-associated factor n=1 Tax=Suricata suricatta TaxID=37032 RepID=A0A673VDI4_SURSU|nr:TNF receptor-associated factor 2 isoform X4 [Suricata suricatta]
MAAASVTPPSSLDLLQPGFSKSLLGTKPEDKYLCSACRNVLRRPFQAQCGHRYCSYCLTSILSSGPQNCAACVNEGIYEEGVSILESGSAHYEVCPKFPLTCEGCGKKKISREKFQDHVQACGKCRVPCRFHAVGCSEMVESEKQQQHEAQWLREHLAMLLGGLLEAKHLSGADGLGQGEPGGWEASTPCPEAEPSKAAELRQRCEALERKTATFENIVCVLNREVERVAMTAEACGRQHRLDQDRIEALSNKVQQLERSIGLKDLAMAELEQKVHEMEASTFDGVFVWKISDFARKRQEAVAGRTPAIFSPAFYTSRYGYKMCLRIYLNGDGTGRGTHLSLFFVVMRGPNDALLRWPFNQKVTLMLLDQNNREHVIDAFRPDVTSSSFQRPVSDMNIASGCPLFCPVSKMEAKNSYVRDDAIFIKAIVDLTGL